MNEDALSKALAAASEAANDSRQLELVKAVLTAQAIAQAMQPTQPQQQAPKQEFDAKKWLTIGGLAIAGGGVACFLAMAAALLAVAVAIGGVCATACLLVLRGLWADFQKGKR